MPFSQAPNPAFRENLRVSVTTDAGREAGDSDDVLEQIVQARLAEITG